MKWHEVDIKGQRLVCGNLRNIPNELRLDDEHEIAARFLKENSGGPVVSVDRVREVLHMYWMLTSSPHTAHFLIQAAEDLGLAKDEAWLGIALDGDEGGDDGDV